MIDTDDPEVVKFWGDRLAHMAKEGAKFGNCGRMCSTCAFKAGSVTQSEPHNIERAVATIAFGGQFNCHGDQEYGNAGFPCVGWQHAKQYFDNKNSPF